MRKLCVLIAALAVAMTGRAMAQTPTPAGPAPARLAAAGDNSESTTGDGESEDGCASGGCGKKGCGRHGGGRNANRWFNCNCNGSYKFPVPPLYTYHWPGMSSMQRMTDYHSPWRFPAIKPYEDETPVRDLSQRPQFRQASAVIASDRNIAGQQEEESVSDKIAQRYATEQ